VTLGLGGAIMAGCVSVLQDLKGPPHD
jgi:hypothetical protein